MKTSQKLDRAIKKDRKVLSVAAQVYGRAPPEKATEIGRFKNAACTSVLIVADLFTAKRGKTRKFSADYQVAASKAFMRRIA